MSIHEGRERELRLAMKRIEVGRPTKIKPSRALSISAVAEEVGIDPSTIHTRYPAIAELIRQQTGRSAGHRRRESESQLRLEKKKNAELRSKIRELDALLASVASKYASVSSELTHLQAILASNGKVASLRGNSRK